MNIRVLFFGATAELVGSHRIETSVSEPAVAADIIEQLHAKYPNLKGRNLLVAINEQYATEDTRLSSGDELAIFTPVSGG